MAGGCCVGDFLPLPNPFEILGDILDSGSSCCVGHSNSRNDTEEHAKKVANELADMKGKTEKSSKELEQKIIQYVNASMDSFLLEIEKENSNNYYGEKLNINVKAIKEKNEQLNKQVVGCITNVMNKRLVQTDKELKTILDEKDEKKRKTNFEKFVKRVQKDALKELKRKITLTVNMQTEVVTKEIRARQTEVNKRLEETVSELTEIMSVKQKSDEDLQGKQIDLMYQSSLCEYLLKECEA